MGIQTQLLEGKKIRFSILDTDLWSYRENEFKLYQWMDGQETGETLTVLEVDEELITIDWGTNTSTLFEVDIELV
jgi:hypothetical protein